MLKRISGTFGGGTASSDPAFLLAPPPGSRSKPASAYPFPPQPHPAQAPPGGIDRTTLHKSLAALSALLVALDDLRSLKLQHAKAQRRVAVALKDLAGGFIGDANKGAPPGAARSDVVVEALGAAATLLDALGETELKHAKGFHKEYEAQRLGRKKEEKVYEDTIASLDAKVAKATASYQSASTSTTSSSSSRNRHAHLDTLTSHHSSYMSTLSSLSSHISAIKASYAHAIAARRELVAREVGRTACSLAEHEWRSRIDAAKRGGGQALGRVVSAARWCEVGMESAAGLFEPDELGEGEGEVDDEVGGRGGPLVSPHAPSDEASAVHGARADEPGRSGTLRGPRAPSTSTTRTAATTMTTTTSSGAHSPRPSVSSAPSFTSRTSSSGGGGGGVSFAPPPSTHRDTATTPRPALPPASSSRYPASPSDGRDTLRSDTFRDAAPGAREAPSLPREWAHDAQARSPMLRERERDTAARSPVPYDGAPPRSPLPPRDDGAMTRSAAVEGVLRRPTPRYGSTPARASSRAAEGDGAGERGVVAAVDEFGRRRDGQGDERARAGSTPQRQDSFVARMSAKYASGGDGHRERERDLPQPAVPPAAPSSSTSPTHARSSSRVSLLAKRYSSPPDAAFSPPSAVAPTHAAPAALSSRPAPPLRGWTDAPRASAPAYESASPLPPAPRAPPAAEGPPTPSHAHVGYTHVSLPRAPPLRDAEDEREREAAHAQVHGRARRSRSGGAEGRGRGGSGARRAR
ncbi:uncharacterized protein RHOBADRAFT_55012 [Rhodotorula graminis WP1]|uniref:Uncharacterized protein n=1 Tax=Rhodotorula graminis (strain WP1) TaxID=578459 RepID=A0A0P9F153_RHOGW|nr:uncharacterized protein RHOBADRAFT_55012 [Rhodotorula graminis WP1]KPV73240.1 hypothetical protein RHOBADRAFT_55012 [Rhodotorula graminis WP1]